MRPINDPINLHDLDPSVFVHGYSAVASLLLVSPSRVRSLCQSGLLPRYTSDHLDSKYRWKFLVSDLLSLSRRRSFVSRFR